MWTRRNEGEKPRDYVGGKKKKKEEGKLVWCVGYRGNGGWGGEKICRMMKVKRRCTWI